MVLKPRKGSEMPWTHYRLTFRLLSPLHVGYRRAGNLMQTRPYVPGRLLWAALTARLTRDAGHGGDAEAYQRIGRKVQQAFRFGYLWPALGEKDNPKAHPNTLYFPWAHDDFDYLLLGSVMSTALDPHQTTAHEGSLHEVEYLAPRSRDDRPVFLLGDLWVNNGAPKGWKDALHHIQLGGERGYGWGRVALVDCKPSEGKRLVAVPAITWDEKADEVVLTTPQDEDKAVFLPAHALAAGEGALPQSAVQGPLEVLVGWGWYEGRYGLSKAQVAYAPGATCQSGLTVRIGPNGIWQAMP